MNKIKEKHKKKILKYYMFDWDDNILVMPTMIHLEHKIRDEWIKMDVTTSEFTHVRKALFDYYETDDPNANWRFYNDTNKESFSEFRDFGPRGKKAFLEDTQKAIQYKKFGPVWGEFIDCVIEGNIFLIITARGHEPITIKHVVKWIVYNILTKTQRNKMVRNLKKWNELFNIKDEGWDNDDYIINYLNLCSFIGIKSDWFQKKFGEQGKVSSPEKYKAVAIKHFVDKLPKFGEMVNMDIEVGFSDDDLATVESVHKYIKNELSLEYSIDFHSYHTKVDGTKTKLD